MLVLCAVCLSCCSGELTSKRRQRVAAESRCQALRAELRRAVGALTTRLAAGVIGALQTEGKEEEAFTLALQQLEQVGGAVGHREVDEGGGGAVGFWRFGQARLLLCQSVVTALMHCGVDKHSTSQQHCSDASYAWKEIWGF